MPCWNTPIQNLPRSHSRLEPDHLLELLRDRVRLGGCASASCRPDGKLEALSRLLSRRIRRSRRAAVLHPAAKWRARLRDGTSARLAGCSSVAWLCRHLDRAPVALGSNRGRDAPGGGCGLRARELSVPVCGCRCRCRVAPCTACDLWDGARLIEKLGAWGDGFSPDIAEVGMSDEWPIGASPR